MWKHWLMMVRHLLPQNVRVDTPGSATILGLMNDDENRVQLLIDKETYEAEYFSSHPCLCTSTIKLKTSDVKNMLLPKVHHEPIVVEL